MQNCPWCGFPLPPDGKKCPNCRWTEHGASTRTAIRAYILFCVVMCLAFGAAVVWLLKNTNP